MDYKCFTLSFVVLCFCLAIAAAECPADKDKDWSYDSNLPNGPPHWGKKYKECGEGKSQSPIDINTKKLTKSGHRQKLRFDNYDKPLAKIKIMNDGHQIHVTPTDGVERSVTLDGKKYKFMHMHFHWGDKGHPGSEDVIDGKRHTMETHLIHKGDGGKMVAIGAFLEEGQVNKAIEDILTIKNKFEYEGDHWEGEIGKSSRQGGIKLEELIEDGCPYYQYDGSIGFPPCTEGITWAICRLSKPVAKKQMDELFSVYSVKKGTADIEKCHMVDIYRPVQPLNDRKVYTQ